ncbi:MAG: hypothetical protein AABY16_03400 [Nanoarchaeota archaeon]
MPTNMYDIQRRVAEAYLELRRLNRKHSLLRFIEKVGPEGLFIWSDKKERLNGKHYPRWRVFYETFSGQDRQVPEQEICRRIPELLPSYYEALQEAIKREIDNI